MLNHNLIMDRISQIRISSNRLKQLVATDKETFLANHDNFAIAEHHLRRALEAVLDIGRHIVAKEGLGRPEDYRGIFELLGQHKILAPAFTKQIQGMAGYRNRLVHDYARVTEEEIFEIISERLDDFQTFTKNILEYIEKH